MSVSLSPLARMQFNQSGIPLAGGLLFTYAAGTTTKLATYTDSTGGTPNTNPIVLDANGQCDIWLTDTVAYKFVLSPSTDTDPPTNAYWTKDNISNVPSPTPTFTSATITGNLTVGTVNKVTITQPTTAATLTIANNKTLTVSNTLTFSGTDSSTVAFGAGGTVVYTGSATTSGLTESTATMLGRTTAGTGAIEEITVGTGLSLSSGTLVSTVSAYTLLPRSARTSNTILAAGDRANFIDITSGTFTQTFTAAATLGNGWWCFLRNSGTGDITIPASDGLTNWNMYPQECRAFLCDGANFYSEVVHPFYRKSTSTFTYIHPPGYLEIEVDLTAAGGGGGAGARGIAGAVRNGGSPGGAAARAARKFRNLTAGGSTTVTIGAGGTGGAAQTVNTTDGADGTTGGDTSFGSLLTVKGGIAGKGGLTGGTGTPYTSGSGLLGAGVSVKSGGGAAPGGSPNYMGFGSTGVNSSFDNVGEGGAGCSTSAGTSGFMSEWGGASSGTNDTTGTTAVNSGSSLRGVSAASCGGWITAANTLPATAPNAGLNGTVTAGGGATGGTCGAAPTVGGNGAAAATDDVCGNPGAGGGSTITGGQTGKAGGNGGLPGGPGGGGGAVLNGQNSGAGGNGANGWAIIKGVV